MRTNVSQLLDKLFLTFGQMFHDGGQMFHLTILNIILTKLYIMAAPLKKYSPRTYFSGNKAEMHFKKKFFNF